MSKTRIYINSAHRESHESTSRFQIDLTDHKHNSINSIEVVSVNMENTFYNVDATNNQIHFEDSGGTSVTATLPVKYYTLSVFIDAVKTQMEIAAVAVDTYTVTHDHELGKLNILIGAGTFILETSNLTKHAWGLLGYATGTDTSADVKHTATGLVNLNHPAYIDIKSQSIGELLQDNHESRAGRTIFSNVLTRVTIDKPFRRFNDGITNLIPDSKVPSSASPDDRLLFEVSDIQLPIIDLFLEDNNGNTPDTNESNWCIELELTHNSVVNTRNQRLQ